MKTFRSIFLREGMVWPNELGIKRVQRYRPDLSIDFVFDDESRFFLREHLTIKGKINEPTLKKIAENILILNRKRYYKTRVRRIILMNKRSYPGYRESSFQISYPSYTAYLDK